MAAAMKGKVVAITGAASGIGLATAKLLVSRGAILSLSDINTSLLQKAVSDISSSNPGVAVHGTMVDIRDRKQVQSWITSTVSRHGGRLDACANIASTGGKKAGTQRTQDITDEEYDFIMDVNVRGTMNCMRAQIPHLREGGVIANASSICGLLGLPRMAIYCAAKHAVIGMTKAAARELGPSKIRVNCVNPGFIDTPMLRSSMGTMNEMPQPEHVAMKRFGKPEEAASLVAWLLSDEASYVTGACMSVDGGWR